MFKQYVVTTDLQNKTALEELRSTEYVQTVRALSAVHAKSQAILKHGYIVTDICPEDQYGYSIN